MCPLPLGITMTVISYPIPAYSNLPIEAQYYQPSRFVISGVTLGVTTVVTTSVNNNYVVGQQVRLLIPQPYGCWQLNGSFGYVLSLPGANQVEVGIDSTNANAFVAAGTPNQPQIIAIGDINTGIMSATGRSIPATNIPGSFINISPL